MELNLMYPEIIAYAFLASFLILLVWRKRKKYKKGVLIANTKYVKKSKYYKYLMTKYRIYNILIKVVCIMAVIVTAYITARLYKTDEHTEEYFNRDIMLCLDVSGSVWNLDKELLGTFSNIVANMKDQRFGLTIFDNSAVTVVPITNDYDYAIANIEELKESFIEYSKGVTASYMTQQRYNYYKIITAGTREGKGSSLIGDGLAYCSSTFAKDKDRTKVVVLATDNISGNGLFTLSEAADYSKQNDVKVYAIGIKTIGSDSNSKRQAARQGLIDAAKKTGGEYYDFLELSTDEISKKIDELDKTAITRESFITNTDLPEKIFPYLVLLIPILFVLDWRVRI